MLQITVPAAEYFDEETQTFMSTPEQVLKLEHSLISISKWESKFKKPFITKEGKNLEETLDYVRCMTLNPNVNPLVYRSLTEENIDEITDYIDDSMTATWFSSDKMPNNPINRDVITSEIIYYWMISYNIPHEYEKWHLNRLITLIRVCNEKNKPQKKMSTNEIMQRNRELNEARRKQMKTKG